MKRIFALLLCVLLLFSLTACKKDKGDNTDPQTETEETIPPTYAHDKLINRFFTEYIGLYGHKAMDTQTIRRGANTKEYLAIIGECTVTVRNVADTHNGLRIIIEGGTTEASLDKMMNAFSLITRSLDTGCSQATMENAVEHLKKQTSTVSDYRFCNYVKVEHYTPIIKEVGVAAKIELLAINYMVADTEE